VSPRLFFFFLLFFRCVVYQLCQVRSMPRSRSAFLPFPPSSEPCAWPGQCVELNDADTICSSILVSWRRRSCTAALPAALVGCVGPVLSLPSSVVGYLVCAFCFCVNGVCLYVRALLHCVCFMNTSWSPYHCFVVVVGCCCSHVTMCTLHTTSAHLLRQHPIDWQHPWLMIGHPRPACGAQQTSTPHTQPQQKR